METTPTISKVSVALSDTEKKIIEGLKNKQGSNFSSALRVIVREWDEIQNSTLHTYKVKRGVRLTKLPRPKNAKSPAVIVVEPAAE